MVVTDAALGNVNASGCTEAMPAEKVHSQSCYAVLLADEQMMLGKHGHFNVLDFRSHRLQRVCRSSYAAETLGCEEGLDAAELCRGFIAELRGIEVASRTGHINVCQVNLVGVTDAKDVYDRLSQDVGFGVQKSLAFSLAALRQQLRRPGTSMRWTSTANLFVDSGTKMMDNSALRETLQKGEWSIEYNESFTKQKKKGAKVADMVDDLPGRAVESKDEDLMRHVYKLAEQSGWHYVEGVGIHVAHNAKSLRSPQPRYSLRDFPYRSSYASWRAKTGDLVWRVLEQKNDMRDMPNLQEQFKDRCRQLVTFYTRESSGH